MSPCDQNRRCMPQKQGPHNQCQPLQFAYFRLRRPQPHQYHLCRRGLRANTLAVNRVPTLREMSIGRRVVVLDNGLTSAPPSSLGVARQQRRARSRFGTSSGPSCSSNLISHFTGPFCRPQNQAPLVGVVIFWILLAPSSASNIPP